MTSMLATSRDAVGDLVEGLENWRIWHLMGTADLRRRYARSRIGEFWLTLSNGIMIVGLGLVWAILWKAPVAELLPYFAVGNLAWLYILGFFIDGSSSFIGSGRYYMNQRMSFSTAIFALIWRNLIMLAHNLLIIVAVFLYFRHPPTWELPLALAGLGLTTVCGTFVAYLLAMLCARFRDVIQVVASTMQVAFFVTPVLWKENFVPAEYHWLVDYNPIAIFLSLIRDPILGQPVPDGRWTTATLITLGVAIVALPIIGHFKRRIIYWI